MTNKLDSDEPFVIKEPRVEHCVESFKSSQGCKDSDSHALLLAILILSCKKYYSEKLFLKECLYYLGGTCMHERDLL